MGKLIRPARFLHAKSLAPFSAAADERAPDLELWPIGALLFVASIARVVQAIGSHERIGAEPTFALLFALGLPWLAFHWRRKPG